MQKNILVDHNLKACVTDFGISRVLQTAAVSSIDNIFSPKTTRGCRWAAPELMTNIVDEQGYPVSQVSSAIDVWAFAMTVVEVRIFIRLSSHC
jgi:serine/threonine protein kinase